MSTVKVELLTRASRAVVLFNRSSGIALAFLGGLGALISFLGHSDPCTPFV